MEDLGVLIAAALDLPREWMARGRCVGHSYDDGGTRYRPSPWQVSAAQSVVRGGVKTSGRELIKLALTFCQSCPVQWDCATYAIVGRMRAGTWAMKMADLDMMQKEPDRWVRQVERWQAKGVPVQVGLRKRKARLDSAQRRVDAARSVA